MVKPTTEELAAYWDELSKLDWFYELSDDYSVWKRGEAAFRRAENKSKAHPEYHDLYRAFQDFWFSSIDLDSNENCPKPPRPVR